MRYAVLAASFLASLSISAALFPVDFVRGSASLFRHSPPSLNSEQRAMNAESAQSSGAARPNPHLSNNDGGGMDDNAISISDILPQTRKINIFASLTRDVPSVTSRLESIKPEDKTTLLAPLNSAMLALPRKPWEDRPGDESGVSAERSEDKAAQNMKRFVEEHVVLASPWKMGPENKAKTLAGTDIWYKCIDHQMVIMPAGLVVEEVVGRVGNGEVWAVKGVMNY